MDLPQALKYLRTIKGTSQSQMASAAGVSTTQYQNYEYGKSDPTAKVLVALADYFDVPIDYLTGRGLFSKWEEINEHWDIIIEFTKNRNADIAQFVEMMKDDRIHIVEFLNALIEDIKIEGIEPNISVTFYLKTFNVSDNPS